MTKKTENRVNVNTATIDEMSAVSGLGPILAVRIIDGRPYDTLDDLTKVIGIGPQSLEQLRPFLMVSSISKQETMESTPVDLTESVPVTELEAKEETSNSITPEIKKQPERKTKVFETETEVIDTKHVITVEGLIPILLSVISILGLFGIIKVCLRCLTAYKAKREISD